MIVNYKDRKCINVTDLESSPISQFHIWIENAKSIGITKPNTAVLSTIENKIYPVSRAVMIKAYDDNGFVFFTDCESSKVLQIKNNDNVSLLFLWLELERQIKVLGVAKKITVKEAFSYFSNRTDTFGGWIKEEKDVVLRVRLEHQFGQMIKRLYEQGVRFSDIFCGYSIVPLKVEFWQVCKNRLYQSFLYEKIDESWTIKTLR